MDRVLVADDHEIVRSGYRRLLEATGRYKVVGEACSGDQAFDLVKSLLPDVVSLYSRQSLVERCFKAGACGYVTKSSSGAVLLEGLSQVLKKERFISPDLSRVIAINQLNAEAGSLLEKLTPREFDVFLCLAKGKSIAEISDTMYLSKKTISNYSSKLKAKLGVTTTAAFVRIAIQEGIISFER